MLIRTNTNPKGISPQCDELEMCLKIVINKAKFDPQRWNIKRQESE